MGAPEERSDRRAETERLAELGKRIREARPATQSTPRRAGDKYTAANMAWRMTLELVVGGMVGAAMGWGLDEVFGTLPLFLIIFILLGFAAGVRTVMRSANEYSRRTGASEGQHAGPPRTAGRSEERRRSDGGE